MRKIISIGWGAHSESLLRYEDELALPDSERSKSFRLSELKSQGYELVPCPFCCSHPRDTRGHYQRLDSQMVATSERETGK